MTRGFLGNAHHDGLRVLEILHVSTKLRIPERRGHDIPRFGALDEVIPVRPACLISIIVGVDDYRGAAEGLLGW